MKTLSTLCLAFVFCILLTYCKKTDPTAGDIEPGIALTFDDADIDGWLELLPVFNKYNARGTFFICTACTDRPLDKLKIHRLFDEGNEIGSHSHHHLNAKMYLQTHSLSEYYNYSILPSIQYFDSLQIPVTSFAYPGGDHTNISDKFLLKYFKKLRCLGLLRLAESDAFVFHRNRTIIYGAFIDRTSPYHLEDIKNAILQAKLHHAVLILVGHSLGEDPGGLWSFPLSLVDSVCNFTVKQNMKFYRMQDL